MGWAGRGTWCRSSGRGMGATQEGTRQGPEPHRALWAKAATWLGLHFRKSVLTCSVKMLLQANSLLTKASPSSCCRLPYLGPWCCHPPAQARPGNTLLVLALNPLATPYYDLESWNPNIFAWCTHPCQPHLLPYRSPSTHLTHKEHLLLPACLCTCCSLWLERNSPRLGVSFFFCEIFPANTPPLVSWFISLFSLPENIYSLHPSPRHILWQLLLYMPACPTGSFWVKGPFS